MRWNAIIKPKSLFSYGSPYLTALCIQESFKDFGAYASCSWVTLRLQTERIKRAAPKNSNNRYISHWMFGRAPSCYQRTDATDYDKIDGRRGVGG